MREIWREIKEWDGHYISNKGNVRRGDKKLALCPNKFRRNYVYVFHSDRTLKPRAFSVHRLVARYFIPNPENKRCVNHIDNNTTNNNLNNLEWVTHQENSQHMVNQGRQSRLKGSECKHSKFTEAQVREILNLKNKLTYIKIAEKYNTNYSNIAHMMRGSRWSHVTKD